MDGGRMEHRRAASRLPLHVAGAVGLGALLLVEGCRCQKETPRPDSHIAADIETMRTPPGFGQLQSIEYLQPAVGCTEFVPDAAIREFKGLNGSPLIPEVIRALSEGDSIMQCKAAQALGWSKDPRAVPALIEKLSDSDLELQAEIIKALGMSGDARATMSLLEKLSLNDLYMKEIVLHALGIIGDPRAAPKIMELVSSAGMDPEVKEIAVRVLGEVKNPDAIGLLVQLLSDSRLGATAATSLGSIGLPALQAALEAMESDAKRIGAALALGIIGDASATDVLVTALKDRNPEVRRNAAMSLGMLKNRAAVQPLIEALDDEDSQTQSYAAQALGEIGDPAAIQPLINSCRRLWVATSAVPALVKMDSVAVSPLIEALGNENENIQGSAADALGQMGDPSVLPALFNVLKNGPARYNAARAIGALGDPSTIPMLAVLCSDRRDEVKENAAMALGSFTSVSAAGMLARELDDPDASVRRAASRSLRSIAKQTAITLSKVDDEDFSAAAQALRLDDEDRQVRVNAAIALGYFGNPLATRTLLETINDSEYVEATALEESCYDECLSCEVTAALARIGNDAITQLFPILARQLSGADASARELAASSVERLAVVEGVDCSSLDQELIGLLEHPDARARLHAASLLAYMGSASAVPALLKRLEVESPDEVGTIIWALGASGDPSVVPRLMVFLGQENFRAKEAAARALGDLGAEEALPELRRLRATEHNQEIRWTAASAISSIRYEVRSR